MPTSTTTQYYGQHTWASIHINKLRCSGGCPDSYTYTSGWMKKVVTVDALPEHRPKPTDLLSNMTSQPKQERKTSVGKKRRYTSTTSCGAGCGSGIATAMYNYRDLPFEGTVGTPPVCDWQTKMRLDIEEVAVNLGDTLAEYRETAREFVRYARGIGTAWRTFRGTLPRDLRKKIRPCDVPASILAYNFGVAPLVGTLFDSVEKLQERLQKPIYRRFTSFDKDHIYKSPYVISGIQHEHRWDRSMRAICYVQLEPDARDFNLGNPIEWAWELIPFSFVIDWGIPVGDYLNALDALKDVKAVKGTLTTKDRFWRRTWSSAVVNSGWWYPDGVPKYTYESHERGVITSIPLPRIPRWDPSKSWKAVLNGLSLLGVLNQRCR